MKRILPWLWLVLVGTTLAPSVRLLSCARPAEDMLADSLAVDSLTALAVNAGDSDISYAPVSTSNLTDASTLLDATLLMTEDSTALRAEADSLQRLHADSVKALSLPRRFLRWLTTPRDSLLREADARFMPGTNFEVLDDSLALRQWPFTDELPLQKGDEVVVAEYMALPGDSTGALWVKLARDQYTMGWVPEEELRGRLLPDDSLSHFVYFFSHSHVVMFIVVLGLFGLVWVARAVRSRALEWTWFRKVGSSYSTLLLWLLATTAFLYAIIQRFFPTVWEQFYYHPSFDPLDLAPLLSIFMVLVWAIVWVGVAVADELYHQSRIDAAFFYGLAVLSAGILLYVLFTFLPFWLGLPAWMGYTAMSARRLHSLLQFRYVCGHCGAKMKEKGVCPVCGAINE
jgi:hypothetical protein